jgi:hypothetical protein
MTNALKTEDNFQDEHRQIDLRAAAVLAKQRQTAVLERAVVSAETALKTLDARRDLFQFRVTELKTLAQHLFMRPLSDVLGAPQPPQQLVETFSSLISLERLLQEFPAARQTALRSIETANLSLAAAYIRSK